MYRVSTNLTLFFRLFIPVFWGVFFGAFTLAVFAYGGRLGSVFALPYFKWGALAFFLIGVTILYFTLVQLKRVEMGADSIYVTNYFRHVSYPWSSVAAIREADFLLLRLVTITLHQPGRFGRRIRFLASRRLYNAFWELHPGLKPPSS